MLRPATIDDAETLLRWRNNPETRRASHATDEVLLASHLRWLQATLHNPALRLLVFELDGVPVGTVRIDAGDVPEISWTVAPEARGCGVGYLMVSAAAAAVEGPLRAKVKRWNEASAKIARRVGMVQIAQEGDLLHFRRG